MRDFMPRDGCNFGTELLYWGKRIKILQMRSLDDILSAKRGAAPMMRDYYKKMPGDRKDGWKLRNVPLFFTVVPFIMRTRLDSQNYYEETLDVEPMMDFLKAHKEDMPNISMMTIFVAAMVRMISQRPALNRFVVHNKLYAHNSITISIAIKRTMSDDGEETMIKPSFDPRDTLQDVQRRLDEAIAEAINHEEGTGIDGVAGLLGKLPAWLFRFAVSMIHFLDNRGWLPQKLVQASPWHCSAMYTNVGSLGIGPIYHHLTELGTYSTFIAMGKRERHTVYDENGDAAVRRTVGMKIVNDERTCDGYYYANSMRMLRRLLMNPAMLLEPPKKVMLDPAVANPLINDPNAGVDAAEEEHSGAETALVD